MFWKKKINGLEAIPDGIEQVQLYVCPYCSHKKRDKPSERCCVCGISICPDCKKNISSIYYYSEGRIDLWFCPKHYKWIKSEIQKLISLKQKDKTDEQ